MFLSKIVNSTARILSTPFKSRPSYVFQNSIFTTKRINYCQTENVDDSMKNITENFGYNEVEASKIINNLNSLTREELLRLGIPKKVASSFFIRKNKIGKFQSIVDLLYIDGVGMKQAMKLCSSALLDTPEDAEQFHETNKVKLIQLMNRKKLIKPNYYCNNCENLISINITPNHIAWTELLCSQRKIIDIQYRPLLKSLTRVNLSKIHDTVLDLVCDIPDADVYLIEHSPAQFNITRSVGLSSGRINYLINNALIRGIALTLLQSKATEGFYYILDSVPMRLFDLKVGYDRQNSVNLVTSILNNSHNIKWLSQIHTDDKPYPHVSHPPASDSALLAVAFLETVHNPNLQALELLL